MVESLNRAALEAYILARFKFHPKTALETILEGVNFLGAHFTPLYSSRAPTSFKLLQAITMGLWYRAHPLALWGPANFSSLDTPPHITLAFPKPHDTADSPNSL